MAFQTYSPEPGKALDLGSGTSRDTRFLLEKGFTVTAVDADPHAEKYLAQLPHQENLRFICTRFKDFDFETYDVINAHCALRFLPKVNFDDTIKKVVVSLSPGGLFIGQLFGVSNEWNKIRPELSFHERMDVEMMFSGFEEVKNDERNEQGFTADNHPKHWYVFSITAQREAK